MRYTLQDFNKDFPDNDACLKYLFETRFPYAECEECGSKKFYRNKRRACFSCGCGKTHLFPKEGTIFEKSSTDLVKWFFAIFLMSQSRNGVAAKEIERSVGVTYKTAWRMAKQIRSLMDDDEVFTLKGEVEADETIIGSKRMAKKNKEKGKYAGKKAIVFGATQRGGKVKTAIVEDTKYITLYPHIQDNIAKGSVLLTDKLHAYKKIASELNMKHERVDHSSGQYAQGKTHTNTIDGFWSQIKRSLSGTYHVVSPKYLPSYLAEFQFRYNHGRGDAHLFDVLLGRV